MQMSQIVEGSSVAIYKNQELVSVGFVVADSPRLLRVKAQKHAGTYLKSKLCHREYPYITLKGPITEGEAKDLKDQIEEAETRRLEEQDRLQQEKAQAEYDALPENIKLARKLRWFCECNREETISQAPIEHIRGIVEWAIANNKEVE